MGFTSAGPDQIDQEIDHGPARVIPFDPVRFAVYLPLAIYLMPVALLVGLIGGAAILAEGASRLAGRTAAGPGQRQGREGACWHRPRSAIVADRARSRAVR